MPSIGQTWVLASIGAVVEMSILSTLKRLLMESTCSLTSTTDFRHRGLMHASPIKSCTGNTLLGKRPVSQKVTKIYLITTSNHLCEHS
jgi:hypothetical protein